MKKAEGLSSAADGRLIVIDVSEDLKFHCWMSELQTAQVTAGVFQHLCM